MSQQGQYQPLPTSQPSEIDVRQQGTPTTGTSWPRTWQDAAGWQARDPIVAGSLTGM